MMIGAEDVAFPRLNLASFYIYLAGAAFALWGMIHGGADTGWTFYTPYSTTTFTKVSLNAASQTSSSVTYDAQDRLTTLPATSSRRNK